MLQSSKFSVTFQSFSARPIDAASIRHKLISMSVFKYLRHAFLAITTMAALPASALPSDEMFDMLKTAPSAAFAESVADDILSAMKESGSPTADLVMERAMLAEQAGQLELARELYDRVVIIKPDFSEAWFRRSLLFLNDDAYDQALYDLNEALTAEPRNFRAWMTLGRVFSILGQDKQALEAYQEALAIYPHYEQALSEVKRLKPLVTGRAI